MEIIPPGTLCLVIRGRNTGKTCIAGEPVPAHQVAAIMMNATKKLCRIVERPENPILSVSTPMTWTCKKTQETVGEFQFIRQRSLLPIPPLGDKAMHKEKEKELS